MNYINMSSMFYLPLQAEPGRDLDTIEIQSRCKLHYAVMYNKDQAVAVCRAVNCHDDLYKALENIQEEHASLLTRLNKELKARISSTDLDDPDYHDYQTCHEARVALAKARGER